MKQAIERSRQLQIGRKKAEKEASLREDAEFAAFWKQRCDELNKAEDAERMEDKERHAELVAFLAKQAEDKHKNTVKQFKDKQENALKTQALLDQQEKNFYSYAEKCISEWQGQGKNVKPLIMELKNYKKRLL